MTWRKSHSELINYNTLNRDAWVAGIASRLPAGTRILDVGAGPARYRPLFAHCDYKTQDFAAYTGSAGGVFQEKWQYAPLDYVSDATAIPVLNASFDAVLCTEVLEHVPEPIKVLGEIGRIVKPGGQAFISAPLSSGLHQQPYHFYGGFTPHFYRKFLNEAGFEVVSIEPNGRFFRLLLQEVHRGAGIVRWRYRRWHPVHWLLALAQSRLLAHWLTYLDDTVPIDEFTVGYLVEAVKR